MNEEKKKRMAATALGLQRMWFWEMYWFVLPVFTKFVLKITETSLCIQMILW